MSGNLETAAPARRMKIAGGKKCGDAAFGKASSKTTSPEGMQECGKLPAGWTEQLIEQLFAPLDDGRTLHQGWSPQCGKAPSPSEDVWGVLKTTSIQPAAPVFTPEQLSWLNLIRDHIATSLSIEPEDLELSPFNQRGGLGKAHQLFGEQLPRLLDELNEVLAA